MHGSVGPFDEDGLVEAGPLVGQVPGVDDGATWPHNRVINPRHYVYQCMAQLPSGDIALLWEREWQGLFLTTVPLAWLTSSHSTIS